MSLILKKLPLPFYHRNNVLEVSRDLPGKLLITRIDGRETIARIVEVEAYAGVTDRASHAFGGRRTARNENMYASAGTVYVYLCYGIHYLVNVVIGEKDNPLAILIRAAEPVSGRDIMLERTGKKAVDSSLTRGPGNLSRSMGIDLRLNGKSFLDNEIMIADDGFSYPKEQLVPSPRIGVGYAREDALLPYRFYIKGHPNVSGKPR